MIIHECCIEHLSRKIGYKFCKQINNSVFVQCFWLCFIHVLSLCVVVLARIWPSKICSYINSRVNFQSQQRALSDRPPVTIIEVEKLMGQLKREKTDGSHYAIYLNYTLVSSSIGHTLYSHSSNNVDPWR